MVVYDESGKRIEEYDLDKGRLERRSMAVEHRWVVDSEERGEWVTAREYPETGGRDVEWRVTAEEAGHWSTTGPDGGEVADFDGALSEDWPHDAAVPDTFEYAVYRAYTEEELAQREERSREAEYSARQAAQLRALNLAAARAKVAAMSFESETEIAEVGALLPDWVPDGHQYRQGDTFQWDMRTWRTSQDTTSQGIYPPGASEALYYEIVVAPDGVIVYRPARGRYDSVREGELRHYPDADGPVYRSKVDWNAYSPDAVPDSWELVSG